MGTPQVTDDGGVRWIALDRPETLNALELGDLAVIASAVSGLPDEADAIALTSTTPGMFSSGMHKNTFNGATPQRAREIISTIGECLSTVRRAPVPTIAMIDGHCLGAALEMVLGCDFRVVTTRSTFGLPEVKLGIPSVIDAALLRHYVGLSLAKEIILTGDLYAVTEFEPRRLFNRVVESAEMRSATAQLLGRVTCLTREVVAAQKELFETWLNGGLQAGIEASIDVFANVFEAPATLHALARYQGRS